MPLHALLRELLRRGIETVLASSKFMFLHRDEFLLLNINHLNHMAFLRGFNSKYIQRKPPPTASLLYQCGIRVVLGCRFKKPNSPTNRKIVRLLSTQATTSPSLTPSKPLPSHCPGCGAQSHTLDEKKAGYYSVTGPAVRRYLGVETIGSSKKSREDAVFSTALQDHRKDVMEQVLGEALQDQSK